MLELTNFRLNHYFSRNCSNGWRLNEHVFPIHSLSLVLKGSIHYKINHQSYFVERGDLVYVKADSVREATPSKDCIFIAMDFESPDSYLDIEPVTSVTISDRVTELLNALEFSWLQQSEYETVRSHIIFLDLLFELLYNKNGGDSNRHVHAIKRYISQNFSKPLTVEKIAEVVQLNPVYCGALFKQEEEQTITQYINHIRISHACSLLMEGEDSVAQIADLCGFKDVFYFSKTFKKVVGISPKKYWSKYHHINH